MRYPVSDGLACGLVLLTLLFVWATIRPDLTFGVGAELKQRIKQHSEAIQENGRQALASEQHHQEINNADEKEVPVRDGSLGLNTIEGSPTQAFAYAFYATKDEYACSVLVNIVRLHNLGAVYPVHVLASSSVSQAYITALEQVGATVHIEEPPPLRQQNAYYVDCLLKLLAFKLHQLSPGLTRVLAFDSDQLIMKNLDHLFAGLPLVDLAAPRAYWLAKDFLSSTFLMISLSDRLWSVVQDGLASIGYDKFDMDLVHDLLGDEVMMLSGGYITINSHWQDWNLPKWHHPEASLNVTTIERINALVVSGHRARDIGPSNALPPNMTLPGSDSLSAGPSPSSNNEPRPIAIIKPVSQTTLDPRFPESHPLHQELYRLQEAAAVIHFFAVGKPWTISPANAHAFHPDAHPLLAEQFEIWRDVATAVCPVAHPP